MFTIDQEPVKARSTGDFGRNRIAQAEPASYYCLALLRAALKGLWGAGMGHLHFGLGAL